MEDELYIPPCCIERKLSPIITRGGACSVFYSQGDWTMQKLWHAVSMLVPSATFTAIVVNALNVRALQFLRSFLVRYPSLGIAIATAEEQTELVRTELADVLDRVWYVGGRTEPSHSNFWLRTSAASTLLVSGPMFTSEDELPHYFCKYMASLKQAESGIELAQMAFRPWRSIFRLHATLRGEGAMFNEWIINKY